MAIGIELTSLISPLIEIVKRAQDEYKHAYFTGLEKYLFNRAEKYFYTNTFLHRGAKVKFLDIYYPLKIKAFGSKENAVVVDLEFIDSHKYISIIGTAGSGKSMIMKFLFIESIKSYFRIPIFIELRRFNIENGSFKKFIFNSILEANLEPSERTLERALKSGVYIFIFDGLDEIAIEKKEQFFHQLDGFIDSYAENKFVISSRPRAGAEQLPRFEPFYVSEICQSEFSDFINKVVWDGERRQNLFNVIKDEENRQYLHYFSSPLLFSMFILTFESYPEIPKRKSSFYQNVFDTLYSMHDGITKSSFRRDRASKLQKEEFIELLAYFSAITFSKGQFYFTSEQLFSTLSDIKARKNYKGLNIEDVINDLDLSISILIKDGFEYTFPHRSLQEYFTSLFIKNYIKSEDAKSKFISKLMDSSRLLSFDRHKHFWLLLYEVDKLSMVKHFLIPLYKQIYKPDHSLGFNYSEFFKSLDFGFYYLPIKIFTNSFANHLTKGDLKKINWVIQSGKADVIASDSLNDAIEHGLESSHKTGGRELKVRHVDSIFWDAIEIRLFDTKQSLFNSLNKSSNLDEIDESIASQLSEPVPDKFMVSFSAIIHSDNVVEILNQMNIDDLLIDFTEQIEEEILKMEDEMNSEFSDLDYLFK